MKRIIKYILIIIIFIGTFFIRDNSFTNVGIAYNEDARKTDRIPVFTFHRLVPDDVKESKYKNNQWVGSVDVFAQMMEYLYKNGYHTISSEELYRWYKGEIELDTKTVMITFDDGFYEDYYLAYPILKKYNFHAISFVVGNRIKDITRPYDKNKTAYVGWDVITKVRKEYPKFEFQSHTYNMHYYTSNGKHRIKSMDIQDLENDFIKNEKFGFNVMAYPYGDYNSKIQRVLESQDYLLAFRFSPAAYALRTDNQYALGRIKINGEATVNTMIKWLDY